MSLCCWAVRWKLQGDTRWFHGSKTNSVIQHWKLSKGAMDKREDYSYIYIYILYVHRKMYIIGYYRHMLTHTYIYARTPTHVRLREHVHPHMNLLVVFASVDVLSTLDLGNHWIISQTRRPKGPFGSVPLLIYWEWDEVTLGFWNSFWVAGPNDFSWHKPCNSSRVKSVLLNLSWVGMCHMLVTGWPKWEKTNS